jgi:Xaa-Pro aminopeptidase
MLLLYRGENFSANFFYHSGLDIDHTFYVEDGRKKMLVVPFMHKRMAEEMFDGEVIAAKEQLAEVCRLARGRLVSTDLRGMSAYTYKKLAGNCRLRDVSAELYEKRAKKRPAEVAKIAAAVKATKKIFAGLDFSGMKTEADVKKYLLRETLEQGLGPAFEPIVASDRNSAFPHYTECRAKLGKIVLVDYGVRVSYYCADLTRVFFLSPDRKAEEQYGTLKTVFREIINELPRLKRGEEVAKFSAKLFREYKLPPLIHSIGHGLGLDVHEYPRLNAKYKDRIAGCAMAIEPAAYYRDYGLRYEETVFFDGRRVKVL